MNVRLHSWVSQFTSEECLRKRFKEYLYHTIANLKVTRSKLSKLQEEAAKKGISEKIEQMKLDSGYTTISRPHLLDYTPYVVARVKCCDIVLSYTTLIDDEHRQVV
ncbi:hypothetical protein FXO38_18649 [Capsicum annuum]|nr:hypothetical protein FXO37_25396 [Capsicum annuum]KAF3647465.1 hypothetical protein FXO38_18649 [Capsicum annuum]